MDENDIDKVGVPGNNGTVGNVNGISGNGEVKQNNNGHPNGEPLKQETTPPTDFKIAEIWLRNGQICLDAGENFWMDRCRALGVIEYCKDIVKTAQMPGDPAVDKKIITRETSPMDFARTLFKRKKK